MFDAIYNTGTALKLVNYLSNFYQLAMFRKVIFTSSISTIFDHGLRPVEALRKRLKVQKFDKVYDHPLTNQHQCTSRVVYICTFICMHAIFGLLLWFWPYLKISEEYPDGASVGLGAMFTGAVTGTGWQAHYLWNHMNEIQQQIHIDYQPMELWEAPPDQESGSCCTTCMDAMKRGCSNIPIAGCNVLINATRKGLKGLDLFWRVASVIVPLVVYTTWLIQDLQYIQSVYGL